MNKQMKPDSQLCREAHVNRNYLAMAKFHNIDKYNYIKKVGIINYKDECNAVRCAVGDMYIELTNSKVASEFFRQHLTGLFKDKYQFLSNASNTSFRVSESDMPIAILDRWKKVLALYNSNNKEILK